MSTDHFGKQVSPVFISRVFVEPVSLFAMECRIQFDSFAAVFARDFCDLLQQAAADSFPPETSVYDQLVDMSQVPRCQRLFLTVREQNPASRGPTRATMSI